ncbi:GntR family transcriptional regulator [Streptomyces atroolivaceus]|uniref:GntR family transcriptional regulator n=1 Tax=Streptomyces atroolivaceus TaxID=66869 RepID=UPI0036615163
MTAPSARNDTSPSAGEPAQGPTPLTRRTAARIVEHITASGLTVGTRLVERALADQLKVSRSPVRRALHLLADDGIVAPAERGGYTVALTGPALAKTSPLQSADDDAEDVYLRIAADRLDGRLPDRVTENALARRYDLMPGQLTHVLRRIAVEGWIERLPGTAGGSSPSTARRRTWCWAKARPPKAPTPPSCPKTTSALTSMETYQDSYRFRLTIEPAAILEPGFVLDRDALETVRAQQQRLVDGEIHTIGNAQLYDLNSRFHEVVMACSRNSFFIDSLHRVDRLRRLIEYRRSLQRDRALVRCVEHVRLADLLLNGKRGEASDYLREHLSAVSQEKTTQSGR